jgi:hypothetical protein
VVRSRYLRFSVRSLLVATGLIGAAIWYIRWPSETAHAFANDPQSFQIDGRLTSSYVNPSAFAEFVSWDATPTLTPHSRSISDYLLGRQTFDCGGFEFTVVRGTIRNGPHEFFHSAVRFYR